jgi:sugar (pentulose or hexulose) kinase
MNVHICAGPTETTAVGNLIFQLLADGKIKSIKEGRQLCANSSKLNEYDPKDTEVWKKYYEHYKKITQCG